MGKRVHFFVSGRVQGVWYRAHAAQKAMELGLSGWVRNCPDGRVELVAEGESWAVDTLVTWCRRGPPRAQVEALEVVEESSPTGEAGGFRVLRNGS